MPSDKWPWHWTFAIVLDARWGQMQELGIYDDENGDPPPKEFWHDTKRVEAWIEDKRAERKKKYEK